MVYNVNLCVSLICKQIGVLATLFCSKNQYDFATLREPLIYASKFALNSFALSFFCTVRMRIGSFVLSINK
jgi:hypothetical protein